MKTFLELILLLGLFCFIFLFLLSWFCKKARQFKDQNDRIFEKKINKNT